MALNIALSSHSYIVGRNQTNYILILRKLSY
uniref:Uncharacterized protein n=1 Tax=Caudovirales sp. ctCiv1 TaxID=2826769 RepID=A0A8S5M8Z9_9CAUD|nr:MAG TPA: hypothetical protein [Caudovirales sp. ctCiv1]